MGIQIDMYKDWMKPQVVDMFCQQYDVKKEKFTDYFEKFYEGGFQRSKTIRVVAMEVDKVIGFQSFFYWPYTFNDKTYNSFQSGNSLVHPDFRGQGIFQKLLNYIYDHNKYLNIDFLMGFPVEASKNSFIRNDWENILNMKWYVKTINPFFFLYPLNEKKILKVFNQSYLNINNHSEVSFKLIDTVDFYNWRANFSIDKKYCYTYQEQDNTIRFQIKFVKRKKYLNDLIIGDIRTNTTDKVFLNKGISNLIKRIRSLKSITYISVAVNPFSRFNITDILKQHGFSGINKEIHFIVKPFKDAELVKEKKNWILYRSDIDTW